MKKIILLVILLFSVSALANSKVTKIKDLIQKTDPHINVGIKIKNLDKNIIIYQQNIHRYFTFASGLKFITLITLLEELGKNYPFTSSISKFNDDYYLDIHDPEFSTQDLEQLILSLKSNNINSIKGNFYIVNKDFLVTPLIPTKTVNDTMRCYGALITRLHINKNCSRINVAATEIGKKALLSNVEFVPYEIENNVITTQDNNIQSINAIITDNKYIASGTIKESNESSIIGAVTHNHFENVALILSHLLEKHDIKLLNGKILTSQSSNNAEIIAVKNNNFFTIVSNAMKKSDNFVTDYLLAEASSINEDLIKELGNRPMEWCDTTKLLKQLVHKHTGVDINLSSIEDGSGISRLNYLTVAQIDQILEAISKKTNFLEILSILATPGEEGTLKNRYTKNTKLYAKTGTLTGVTSLLGYFHNKKGELNSFVIVINNIHGSLGKFKLLEDDIISLLAN